MDILWGVIMDDLDKKELQNEFEKLQREKEELINDIRDLDWAKIIKLEKENEELQKKVEWLDKDKKKTDREKENLSRQLSNSRPKMWLNSLKIITAIGLIDIIIIPLLVIFLGISLQWIFLGIGIVTFFGILLLVNYMSGTSSYDSGEIRKAVTGSFITVYLIFVPLISFGTINIPSLKPIGSFTWIVGIIVIFYFVSRTIEEYVKIKHGK
jgi:hypothetical protein